MKVLLELTKALQGVSGRNEKKALLIDHAMDLKLSLQLQYIFDPYRRYHVTSESVKPALGMGGTEDPVWIEWAKILDYLVAQKSNSRANQLIVAGFIGACKPKWHDLLLGFLDKDWVGTGVKSATVNSLFVGGSKIPDFKVALARPLDRINNMPFEPAFVSRKFDGVRVIASVEHSGLVRYFSRGGHQFSSLEKLTPFLRQFPGWVFDGEVCVIDKNGLEDFTGAVSQIKSRTYGSEVQNPRYYVFDLLKREEYFEGVPSRTFRERYEHLLEVIPEGHSMVKAVSQSVCSTGGQLGHMFQEANKLGWEGLMLRNPDSIWIGKRTKDLLKVKAFCEKEFPVVGCIEGLDQFAGMLGALTVEITKLGDKVDVGSGFSVEERKRFWAHRKELIGKYITVKYFEVSKNKHGGVSLRFPIFKGVRDYE